MFENKSSDNIAKPAASKPAEKNSEFNIDEIEFDEIKFNLDFGDLGDFFCEGNSIFTFSEELGISDATK